MLWRPRSDCRGASVRNILELNRQHIFLITNLGGEIVGVGILFDGSLFCALEKPYNLNALKWGPMEKSNVAVRSLPSPFFTSSQGDFAIFAVGEGGLPFSMAAAELGEELTLIGTDRTGLRLGLGLVSGPIERQMSDKAPSQNVSVLGADYPALTFGPEGEFRGLLSHSQLIEPSVFRRSRVLLRKPSSFGMKIVRASNDSSGVLVLKSPVLSPMVAVGDIITHVEGIQIRSPAEFLQAASNSQGPLRVLIERDGEVLAATLEPLKDE